MRTYLDILADIDEENNKMQVCEDLIESLSHGNVIGMEDEGKRLDHISYLSIINKGIRQKRDELVQELTDAELDKRNKN